MLFTARSLEALKVQPIDAAAKRSREHFADGTGETAIGLAIRVAPTGRKTFTYHFTYSGKRARMDLGTFPATGLADARNRAHEARRALESSPPQDPREVRRIEEAAASAEVMTVSKLFAEYIADLERVPAAKRLRTISDIKVMLRNQVEKFIGNEPLSAINPTMLKGVVDRIRERGSHSMAYRVHKNMRLAFEWAANNTKHLTANPMEKMKAPEEAAVGEKARPLDDDEIKAFWNGIAGVLPEYCRHAYSRILRLCLLSGCRVGEAAEIGPGEILGNVWTIPAARSKNKKAHAIPLTTDMLAIIGNNSDDPWGLINGKPIKSIRLSDAFHSADASGALGIATADHGKAYTIHSLRRTVATCMDEIGLEEATISLCLNHTMNGSEKPKAERAARVTKLYIKPKTDVLMQRKRVAFEAWNGHLRLILEA